MPDKWTDWERVPEFEFTDILYEKRYHRELGAGVARISFNRPDALNAFTGHTAIEVCQAIDDGGHDDRIGVLVITGVGDRAFSSGGDVRWEAESRGGGARGSRWLLQGGAPVINHFVRRCRKPLIAAIKGYVIGGAHHLAYMCDFSIAAENAVFGQTGPRVGSPADGLVVSYLTRVVGAKKAREIWMLTRQYTAQEALHMGLINRLVPLDRFEEEVDKWCEEVLMHFPTCISILKASFDADVDYMDGSMGRFGNLISPDFFASDECKEAQDAFLERRAPSFWKYVLPRDNPESR